jgi:hypothetical protein
MTNPSFSQRIEGHLDFNRKVFFLVLTIFYVTIRYITNDIILQSIPGYEDLEESGTFMYFHIFNTLNYLWTPFSLLWKFLLTTFVLWMAAFAWGYKVSFIKIWGLVMFAEIIFIIPEILKLLGLIFYQDSWNLTEMRNWYPFSLLSLTTIESVKKAYIYPLQALNLFELTYILYLTMGMTAFLKKGWKSALLIVGTGYLFLFLSWLAFYILAYR